MSALRAAIVAAILAAVSFGQAITLPGQSTPVSLTWLYYNKMRWAGAWSASATYNPQDLVTYGGSTYVSLAASNLNNTPAAGIWWAQVSPPVFPSGSPLQYLRIQPNTGGTTSYQFAALPVVNPTDYAFTPQAPGGSLIQYGVNQAIAMAPCPLGMSGAPPFPTVVWLSGGTGAAESTLITGGTCTSGAASGTITVTPAYAHSGTWTVGPATGGLQEAVNVTPNGGVIAIPVATFTR